MTQNNFVHLTVDLLQIILFGFTLLAIGSYGLWSNRRNLVIILMSVEMALVGISVNFVAVSVFYCSTIGQLFALLILVVAAAESAIGLALIITWHRISANLNVTKVSQIKG